MIHRENDMAEREVIDVGQIDIYKRYSQVITDAQRTGKMDSGDLGAKYVEGVNDAFTRIYGTMFTTIPNAVKKSMPLRVQNEVS